MLLRRLASFSVEHIVIKAGLWMQSPPITDIYAQVENEVYSCLESMFNEDEERGMGTQLLPQDTASELPSDEAQPPDKNRSAEEGDVHAEGGAGGDSEGGGGAEGQKEVCVLCVYGCVCGRHTKVRSWMAERSVLSRCVVFRDGVVPNRNGGHMGESCALSLSRRLLPSVAFLARPACTLDYWFFRCG